MTRILKDILQVIGAQVSTFQLGKILFERNREIDHLESLIQKNAENLIDSELFN